jgi:xylan 1,4-beta-xylosidase
MIPSIRPALPLLAMAAVLAAPAARADDATFPVTITVHADQVIGDLHPIWRFFGCDEPNYAEAPNGRKLVAELGQLRPSEVYFRTHNLLTTGDGEPAFKWGSTNAYTEDRMGRPVYDWTILDDIFDAYYSNGVRPYVEVGFMPEAMSTHPEPYRHHWKPGDPYKDIYTGWAYPPKDYAKWEELAYQWANHCVERYGADEVNAWYWEVWNEPNGGYWKGTPEEFRKLHDYAVAGIRRALPSARIGGADTAGDGGAFTRAFIEHCLHGVNYATGKVGTPLDFISFHAKGSPQFVDGHVRMGIANQLRAMDRGFAIVRSFPETRSKPIIVGESDPDGCAACTGPQLGYRNTAMYSSYTAESVARELELADLRGVNLEGTLTWAFEFEDTPLFAGYRALATGGVDKPVLNVFRMLSKMGGSRAAVQSSGAVSLEDILAHGIRGKADVSALAAVEPHRISILTWNYHDDDVPGPSAAVRLAVQGLPPSVANVRVTHYRVDEDHSNAFTAWKTMGSPANPTPDELQRLQTAGKLSIYPAPASLYVENGQADLEFSLPRQAVSLLVLEWN